MNAIPNSLSAPETSLSTDEEQRICRIYSEPDRVNKSSLYSWHRAEVRHQQRTVAEILAKRLIAAGLSDLSTLSVLDVGCGKGRFLRSLIEWGIPPNQLHGIDLIEERIQAGQQLSPAIDFQLGNGLKLPFANDSISLCTTWTVLSSVTHPEARASIASEMLRVTQPGGFVLVYDFAISDPRNSNTLGIPRKEIKRLFPNLPCQTTWTTLAPPISRRLAKVSPTLMAFAEWALPFLSTHRVYWIQKPAQS